MARDPVCGMDVDESQTSDTSQHNGHNYYFCSPGCRTEFDRSPERYTGTPGLKPEGIALLDQGRQRSQQQGQQSQRQSSGQFAEAEPGRKRRKAS